MNNSIIYNFFIGEIQEKFPQLKSRKQISYANLLSTIYSPLISGDKLSSGVFISSKFLKRKFLGYNDAINALIAAKLLEEIRAVRHSGERSGVYGRITRKGKKLISKDDFLISDDGKALNALECLKSHFPHKFYIPRPLQMKIYDLLRKPDLAMNPYWDKITIIEDGVETQLESEPCRFGKYEDGRSFSHRLHCLKRDERKQLRLCGEEVTELYDIPHAYPYLVSLILSRDIDKLLQDAKTEAEMKYAADFKKEVDEYCSEVKIQDRSMDIYSKMAERCGCTRDEVKAPFNKFINSTPEQLSHSTSIRSESYDPILRKLEESLFERWPLIVKKLEYWPIENESKEIVHQLQREERKIMLEKIQKLGSIPFFTIHDALYVRKSDLIIAKELIRQKYEKTI